MVLTVSIINRDARINASGIVDYAIVCFISFLSVKHTLIDHSQAIFSPQNAASYQDFPACSVIHDLFGKKIIGLMSFLSGELEILYCGDKRVFVSFLNCAIETVYKKECILYFTIVNIAGVRKWKYVVLGELNKIKIISWSWN